MRPLWQAFFCLLAPGSPQWGEGPENNRHLFIQNSGNGCWATLGSGPCSQFTIGDLLLSERTVFPSSLCPELLQFSKLTMFPFVSDQYGRAESVVSFPCQSGKMYSLQRSFQQSLIAFFLRNDRVFYSSASLSLFITWEYLGLLFPISLHPYE